MSSQVNQIDKQTTFSARMIFIVKYLQCSLSNMRKKAIFGKSANVNRVVFVARKELV